MTARMLSTHCHLVTSSQTQFTHATPPSVVGLRLCGSSNRILQRFRSKRCALRVRSQKGDRESPIREFQDVRESRLRENDTLQTASEPTSQNETILEDPEVPFLLVSLLAGTGALETAYLSLVKLLNAEVVCPATGSGCETVLNSEWANLFGVPLPFLGFLSYSSVAGIALLGRTRRTQQQNEYAPQSWVDGAVRSALLGGGLLLASCSAFFMFILLTKFPGDYCTWCIGSALLSLSILMAVTSGFTTRQLQDAAAPSFTAVGTIALVLAFNFGSISNSQAQNLDIPYQEPPVTSSSSNRAILLAKQLKDAGASMYGAFWCSHCYDQKVAFGREAMADFPYVECYPDGFRKGVKIAPACDAAGIRGFPTWVIGGSKLEGEQSFDVLESALTSLSPAADGNVAALAAPTSP